MSEFILFGEKRFVPEDIQLGRVKSTFEHHKLSRPSLNKAKDYNPNQPSEKWIKGLPDTWDWYGTEFVFLTERLQYLWYDENSALTLDTMTRIDHEKSFESLTDDDLFATNRFGSETCRVYPTGKNPDKGDMRLFTILTPTVIEIAGSPRIAFGENCYPFWVIDINKDVGKFHFRDYPFRWYRPKNSIRSPLLNSAGKWLHGFPEYKEDWLGRFPQFRGDQTGSIAPITPLLSISDIGWIPVKYVELLDLRKPLPKIFNM